MPFMPDFIISIGGKDITKYVKQWELVDNDDQACTFTVEFANPDFKFSGAFKMRDSADIKFGEFRNTQHEASLLVKGVDSYCTTGELYIRVTAHDITSEMSEDCHRGNFQKDTKTDVACRDLIERSGADAEVKIKPAELPSYYRLPLTNYPTTAALYGLAAMSHATEYQSKKDERSKLYPQKSKKAKSFKGKSVVGAGFSGSGTSQKEIGGRKKKTTVPGDPEGYAGPVEVENVIGDNRLNNASHQAYSLSVTGSLTLVGVPILKAKKGVTILNVGADSGKWYVQSSRIRWDVHSGYRIEASLLRTDSSQDGSSQDGSSGGDSSAFQAGMNQAADKISGGDAGQPIVLNADLKKGKPKVYLGPRNIGASSQATFTYGDGNAVELFHSSMSTVESRDAGKEAVNDNMIVDEVQKKFDFGVSSEAK